MAYFRRGTVSVLPKDERQWEPPVGVLRRRLYMLCERISQHPDAIGSLTLEDVLIWGAAAAGVTSIGEDLDITDFTAPQARVAYAAIVGADISDILGAEFPPAAILLEPDGEAFQLEEGDYLLLEGDMY